MGFISNSPFALVRDSSPRTGHTLATAAVPTHTRSRVLMMNCYLLDPRASKHRLSSSFYLARGLALFGLQFMTMQGIPLSGSVVIEKML